MIRRVAAAVRMLRPRTIAEASARLANTERAVERVRNDVADLERTVNADRNGGLDRIEREVTALRDAHQRGLQDMQDKLVALTRAIAQLQVNDSQLRAIALRDAAQDRRILRLKQTLNERSIAEHVNRRISGSTLQLHPFPHAVVDDLLPQAVYDALLEAIPPVELFANRPFNKQQVGVPLTLGPRYSRHVWQFVARTLAPRIITPAVLSKFRVPLETWLGASLAPDAMALLDRLHMACTDGRILLRGRGYNIPPHRDPKWGFITCLMYLARPDDDRSLGTQLYSVTADTDAPDTKPHWIPPDRCRLEATVELRPNRALIFLNSSGAHGAQIPDEAPESLERYIYQFRIGPGRGQIREVLGSLPPELRSAWEGKIGDY